MLAGCCRYFEWVIWYVSEVGYEVGFGHFPKGWCNHAALLGAESRGRSSNARYNLNFLLWLD